MVISYVWVFVAFTAKLVEVIGESAKVETVV